VIEQTARALGSPLFHVTPAHTTRPPLDRIQLPLLGAHQRLNAATALATIHTLQSALPVSEPSIRQGLETVQWAGRLQLVDRPSPRSADISVCPTPPPPTPAAPDVRAPSGPPAQRLHILLDGAHNAAGAAVLRAAFKEQFEGIRSALILGMLDDKDWSAMCQILAPCADEVVCVPVKSERSADPRQLAQACRQAAPSVPVRILDSLACALEQTSGAPLTVVAGSLYLVGETLEWLDRDGSPPCAERALNEYTARSR
jgi:dihydrofolate synthase/folylpolyglutamate synthase